jgi:hypothetical protein
VKKKEKKRRKRNSQGEWKKEEGVVIVHLADAEPALKRAKINLNTKAGNAADPRAYTKASRSRKPWYEDGSKNDFSAAAAIPPPPLSENQDDWFRTMISVLNSCKKNLAAKKNRRMLIRLVLYFEEKESAMGCFLARRNRISYPPVVVKSDRPQANTRMSGMLMSGSRHRAEWMLYVWGKKNQVISA